MKQLILVRAEPPGSFTAQAVGFSDIRASAPTREEAVQRVTESLNGLVASGDLLTVDVAEPNPLLQWAGWERDDPDYPAFLEELARNRQEDLERTLQELDSEKPCSDSSSTPTT